MQCINAPRSNLPRSDSGIQCRIRHIKGVLQCFSVLFYVPIKKHPTGKQDLQNVQVMNSASQKPVNPTTPSINLLSQAQIPLKFGRHYCLCGVCCVCKGWTPWRIQGTLQEMLWTLSFPRHCCQQYSERDDGGMVADGVARRSLGARLLTLLGAAQMAHAAVGDVARCRAAAPVLWDPFFFHPSSHNSQWLLWLPSVIIICPQSVWPQKTEKWPPVEEFSLFSKCSSDSLLIH